jgi:hypothetical protein
MPETFETLASFLFIIVLDYALRQAISGMGRRAGVHVSPTKKLTYTSSDYYGPLHCKGSAWRALHAMRKIWRSSMSCSLKRKLFIASVESIFLYGAESWTMTKAWMLYQHVASNTQCVMV